jgi:hypothetical protein
MTYNTILAGSEPGTETEEEIERISNAGNLADLLERAGGDLGPAIRRDVRINLQQSPGKILANFTHQIISICLNRFDIYH